MSEPRILYDDSVVLALEKPAGLHTFSRRPGEMSLAAWLVIDEVPVTGTCKSCGKHFSVEETYVIQCPLCGSFSFTVETGRELNVAELEVE